MVAFAANSILTRLAVDRGTIDAASFTAVRLLAGAAALGALAWGTAARRGANRGGTSGSARAGLVLFAYAAAFSYAYVRIGAAVGALILFAAIQITMIGWGLVHGDRPPLRTWGGLSLSVAGLLALTLPGASRPDLLGAALMILAGIASGTYSLLGKKAPRPLVANAASFAWTLPLAGTLLFITRETATISVAGLGLAIVAGAFTSGFAYALWWRALHGLTATQGAVVQLSVPVLAAVAGVALLGEMLTARLIGSGFAVLFGIALALRPRRPIAAAPVAKPLASTWPRRTTQETWAKR